MIKSTFLSTKTLLFFRNGIAKMLIALSLLFLFNEHISAQTPFDDYLNEGIKLHDKGDYNGAIKQYQQALQLNPNSSSVNYEIANTYFSLKNYQKTIEYSDKVLSQEKSPFRDHAYIIKGSALDLLGKPQNAIDVYKSGIKEYPDNYLLYYNLALTLYNSNGKSKDIEESIRHALLLKPTHASSHLLLGYLMNNERQRVKSVLCLYNFLLLEPKNNRAADAYQLLVQQLEQGVKKENGKPTTIIVSDNKLNDDFSAIELSLSLMAASKGIDKNKEKTEMELFIQNTSTLFSISGELKKDNKNFWWVYYVDFFYNLQKNNFVEPLAYFISQSKNDPSISSWLEKNDQKVKSLLSWSYSYRRN